MGKNAGHGGPGGIRRRPKDRFKADHRPSLLRSSNCRRLPGRSLRSQSQMTSAAVPSPTASKPAEHWREALLPVLGHSPGFAAQFLARLRAAKLTFGDRVHCPFLRPVFLSPQEEQHVRIVAETIAALGEPGVAAALKARALFAQSHLPP